MLLSLFWSGGANCPEDDHPAPSKHPQLRLRLISVTLLSATVSLSTPHIHCHAGWRECWHVVICAYVPIIFVIVQLKIFLTGSCLPCTVLFLLYFPFFVSAHLEDVEKRKYRSFSLSRVKERGLFQAVAWTNSSCQRCFNCYRTKDLRRAGPERHRHIVLNLQRGSVKLCIMQNKAWPNGNGSYLAVILQEQPFINWICFLYRFSIVCHKPIPAYTCIHTFTCVQIKDSRTKFL